MIKVCPSCQQKYPEDTEFCAKDGTRLEELQDETEDSLIGRVLEGRWVIQERIGEGGMGSVYLASQRSVDRQVAIKTLKPELCNSREFVDRFFREARVASNIAHPHCVTILDFGQTDDGILFLAMEFLDGLPLSDRLRHPDLGVREIIKICIQISSALAAAHQQNIIHRDLKPDNVFLLSISDGSTFTKVLDFGIAKVLDSEEKMTKTGQVFGTPEYMSPEQCRGDQLDGRSDLYSLGCILYRMLSGRTPFESDTPMAVLVSHVSEQPPHISEVMDRDDIPEALIDLCMRLLAKSPDDRPADGQAVRAELEQMLGDTSSGVSAVAAPAEPTSDTMAATAADGGAPASGSQSAPVSGSQSAPNQATDPAASQRTNVTDGNTTAPAAVDAPKEKSSMGLILGVGLIVLLGAGCTIGAIYMGYSKFAGDGDDGFLAGIIGDVEAETNAPDDDDEGNEGDDEAGSKSGDSDESEDDDGTKLAQNDSPDDEDSDDSTGAKSDDSDPDAGSGAAKSSGGSKDDDKTKTDDGDSDNTETVDIEADKAEVTVKDDDDDDQDDEASSDSDDEDDPKEVAAKTDTKDEKKVEKEKVEKKEEKPPEPSGSVRKNSLTTRGSGCIKPNVEQVMRGAERRFHACYSDHLDGGGSSSGEVFMQWEISTDASLLRLDVRAQKVPEIKSCLTSTLKRLSFDAPIGSRCHVRASYQFSP
jgi:eukaryotic-like serine/threonine-protein kinase